MKRKTFEVLHRKDYKNGKVIFEKLRIVFADKKESLASLDLTREQFLELIELINNYEIPE